MNTNRYEVSAMPSLQPSPLQSALQQRLFALGKSADTTDSDKQSLFALVAAIEAAQQQGNGCVLLSEIAPQLAAEITDLQQAFPTLIGDAAAPHTPIVHFAPFVAFRRRYREIADIAAYFQRQSSITAPSEQALSGIDWHIGADKKITLNEAQRLAALTAASLPLTVMTGGAGTGKTTTLSKALELILLDNPAANIQLAAPTGKAAQRLNESLRQQLAGVNPLVRESLSELQATTLHRLLKISEKTGRAQHHAANPIFCDVLAVDESSMLGGALFRQLIEALLPTTRLILLGDANQLPAIDSLPFFNEVSRLSMGYTAEFCRLAARIDVVLHEQSALLPNQLCRLTATQRFAEASIIQQSADAVLANDVPRLISGLGEYFYPLSTQKKLFAQLVADYPESPQTLLTALSQRMVLCSKRQGRYGSEAINQFLDNRFRQRLGGGLWYEGRRILIEQNDYQLNINNGDIGVCRYQQGDWVLCFDDGRELPISRLPQHYSLAFAISIHKSQGSEYQHVSIVLDDYLPTESDTFVNKALLYTAITRAKIGISIYANSSVIQQALQSEKTTSFPLETVLRRLC